MELNETNIKDLIYLLDAASWVTVSPWRERAQKYKAVFECELEERKAANETYIEEQRQW